MLPAVTTITRTGPNPSAPALAQARPSGAAGEIETRLDADKRAIRAAAVLGVIAFALVVASNLVSLGLDHLRTNLINANWEFSWSHDLDTLLLAVGTCTAVAGARASGARRRLWLATAGILALFFLDEVSALHGQVGNLDKLLYTPILVALVLCVWRLTEQTPDRMLVIRGLTTLLFSFAMHVAGLHLLRQVGYTTYLYQVGVGFKEGAELAGLILLVTALWRRAFAGPT